MLKLVETKDDTGFQKFGLKKGQHQGKLGLVVGKSQV